MKTRFYTFLFLLTTLICLSWPIAIVAQSPPLVEFRYWVATSTTDLNWTKEQKATSLLVRNHFDALEEATKKVCIFEILQFVNGRSSEDLDTIVYPGRGSLPAPFAPLTGGNDNVWKQQFSDRTGVLPRWAIGPEPEGFIGATWNPPKARDVGEPAACGTDAVLDPTTGAPLGPKLVEPGASRWSQPIKADRIFFSAPYTGMVYGYRAYLSDGHGTMAVDPPRSYAPYKISSGFYVRQSYAWYRYDDPSNVYPLMGPFYIRRWVDGIRSVTCRDKNGVKGEYSYALMVAKSEPGGKWKWSIVQSLGCGGAPYFESE